MNNNNYRIVEGSPQLVANICDELCRQNWDCNGSPHFMSNGDGVMVFQSMVKRQWSHVDPKWLSDNLTVPCSTKE